MQSNSNSHLNNVEMPIQEVNFSAQIPDFDVVIKSVMIAADNVLLELKKAIKIVRTNRQSSPACVSSLALHERQADAPSLKPENMVISTKSTATPVKIQHIASELHLHKHIEESIYINVYCKAKIKAIVIIATNVIYIRKYSQNPKAVAYNLNAGSYNRTIVWYLPCIGKVKLKAVFISLRSPSQVKMSDELNHGESHKG